MEQVQTYKDKNGKLLKIGDSVVYGKEEGSLQNVCGVSMLKLEKRYIVLRKVDFSKVEKIDIKRVDHV